MSPQYRGPKKTKKKTTLKRTKHTSPVPFVNQIKTFRFTEAFAGILKRQLQLGDARIAGAAIYMEAIFQATIYANLSKFATFRAFFHAEL